MGTAPPTVVMFCNDPKAFTERYGDRFRAVLRGEFQQVLLEHGDVFGGEAEF